MIRSRLAAIILLALLTVSVRGEEISARLEIPLNGDWQCEPGVADSQPSQWTHAVPRYAGSSRRGR